MKKWFRKDTTGNRADSLRGTRIRDSRAAKKPVEFPQVMPPLPVISLDEADRSNSLSDALFKRSTRTMSAQRPSMVQLVYPPIRGATPSAFPAPEGETGQHTPVTPNELFRKLTNKPSSQVKAEPESMQTAANQPSAVYLTPRQYVPRPVKAKRSLRELRLGWRLLSLLLACAMSYAIYVVWTAPTFKMLAPTISGNVRVASEEFINNLAVEGIPSFMLVPDQLRNNVLNTFPEVVSADLEFQFPNKLHLNIIEREPVLIWKQGGQTYWIDLFGIPMLPRGQAGNWYVVTASGNATGPVPIDPVNHPGEYQPVADPGLILTILTLGNLTPAGTTIAYDPRYGLGWNDPEGWKVFFGFNTENFDSKLAQYAGIVTNLNAQGIQPAIISVQYPYAPFYRLEQ